MRSLFRPSKIVGLDIGTRELKAVAVSSGPKNPEITNVARVSIDFEGPSPDYPSLEKYIQEMAASGLFPSEWIISGLNGNSVAVRTLTIPQFQRQDGNRLVKYEMESLVPYKAEDMVVDYFVRNLPENGKCRIFAMAAQKKEIASHLALLKNAHMEATSLGWNALGAYWALVASPLYPPGRHVVCS